MKDKSVFSGGNMPTSTSLTLLESVKHNDKDAWHRLVELYAPMIYSRCRRRWQLSPSEAENISQEVFTSVVRKISEFQRQRSGSFRKWLNTITDNKTKDHLAKIQTAAAAGGTAARELIENVADPFDDDENEQQLDGRCEVIQKAIQSVKNEFSERDIQIFWNVIVEGRYRSVVADDLGISPNTVYIVCSRIRKRLREIYEDLIDPDLLDDPEGEQRG